MCSCHVYALKLETAFRKGTAVRLVQMNLRRIFKERWHIINPLGEIVYLIKHQNARPSCHIRRKGHVLHHL